MTATYAASRRLGRAMPSPEVPVLLPGSPPTSTKEVTEQPESRYYSLEKMWAGTHPAVQGGIILGLTVVFVMAIRAVSPHIVTLVRILWNGGGADKAERTPDVRPQPFTPPPETTEADKRHAELLAATERSAAESRAAKQSAHDTYAAMSAASAAFEKRMERRMDRIEERLDGCITQREIDTMLELIKRLSLGR